MVFAVILATLQLNAQDWVHYKQIVKELSSPKHQGRGYAKGGANKAGNYHTIYGTYENAIFDNYEPIFKIVTDFIKRY